jgi:hypothetical protein
VKAELVGHSLRRSVLDGLREVLDDAEEAVLCSAFVRRAGVHLVQPQLEALADRGRFVATSTFGGESTQTALAAIDSTGVRVRIANPSRGTFHPKVYVARRGDRIRALVGSANLTGGLITNVEAAVLLDGSIDEPVLRDAWSAAVTYWSLDAATMWQPMAAEAPDEVFPPALYTALQREIARDPVFLTVTQRRRNLVTDLVRDGLWIETDASLAKGRSAQFVPAWMLALAWEYLLAHGTLTNRHLLATDGLNVKRSSAVCGILARLPGISVASTRPVTLEVAGQRGSPAA